MRFNSCDGLPHMFVAPGQCSIRSRYEANREGGLFIGMIGGHPSLLRRLQGCCNNAKSGFVDRILTQICCKLTLKLVYLHVYLTTQVNLYCGYCCLSANLVCAHSPHLYLCAVAEELKSCEVRTLTGRVVRLHRERAETKFDKKCPQL